jgi:hypothetical protein
MPQHAEGAVSQIDASARPVAQFFLPQIEGQISHPDQIRSAQAA